MDPPATVLTADPQQSKTALSKRDPLHDAAVGFLFSRLNYERVSPAPYCERTLKLARMRELLDRLGQPQTGIPIIHVAGTKGKGSTAAMIAAVLSAAGFRTGLFSSPHLDRIEERFCIDGLPCRREELVRLVDRVRPVTIAMDAAGDDRSSRPTYFELTTALALLHFAAHEVDAAVLEVGLGGRLDSTNVCQPRVCVITNISLDHTQQLGKSLASIAREKAGILKPGIPVVSGVCDAEPQAVIVDTARQRGAPLIQLGQDFDYQYTPPDRIDIPASPGLLDYFGLSASGWSPAIRPGQGVQDPRTRAGLPTISKVPICMPGRHQAVNAAVAVATVLELCRQGWSLNEEAIRLGLAKVSLPARIEVLHSRPTVLVDAAHNVASMQALTETIQTMTSARRRILILASTRDKDTSGILDVLLPHFDAAILTQYLDNPRATPVDDLANSMESARRRLGPQSRIESLDVCSTPLAAWEKAGQKVSPDDLICITGSFFIAAEIRRIIKTGLGPC
ncbi:MAG: bifunctional folylpolyglutamate synthase/dihydrofolate synthase [Pirellulales bacterium]|nr:bifunctional folylpolyglutamate synthase/dihydrofolate synthase [Pirellulales bacterium]